MIVGSLATDQKSPLSQKSPGDGALQPGQHNNGRHQENANEQCHTGPPKGKCERAPIPRTISH